VPCLADRLPVSDASNSGGGARAGPVELGARNVLTAAFRKIGSRAT